MFILRACSRAAGGSGIGAARGASRPPAKLPAGRRAAAAPDGIRPLSSSSGDGTGGGDDQADSNSFLLRNEADIPAPPSYVRDAVTGKWTDRTLAEPSPGERRLLGLDDEARSEEVMDRLGARWKAASEEAAASGGADGALGSPSGEHGRVARRIQEQRLALGPIGRDPSAAAGDGGGAPLTPREYQALKAYAGGERGVRPSADDPDLIPHNSLSSRAEGGTDAKQFFDADLDLAYLNPKLNRRAFGVPDDHSDPLADLLPSDLNPARKVNRRHARPIPGGLLHHNNLSLLRRYTTPGGKIMNRVQSRLGAKDQRKVSRLVKRARHMGLIPHIGQWKFEDHGRLHEPGLEAAATSENVGLEAEGKRDWEVELEQRGLWPLQDETELIKKFYDMEKMLDNIAGPKGGKKRQELERLLGGVGALVKEDDKAGSGNDEGGSAEQGSTTLG